MSVFGGAGAGVGGRVAGGIYVPLTQLLLCASACASGCRCNRENSIYCFLSHKQASFESGFEKQKSRRLSEIGGQIVPDRRCKKFEGVLSGSFRVLCFGTLRRFSHNE